MQTEIDRKPWGAKTRLQFIEQRLYWEGRLRRSDLTDFFDISTQQASGDISDYQQLAPQNIQYNKNEKYYCVTNIFQPVLVRPDSEWYLFQLLSASKSDSENSKKQWSTIFDVIPIPKRSINPECLRSIISAIRNQFSIRIRYQSLSKPEPIWRQISPHALAFDGNRWHVRAFCHRENKFKDFAISRVFEVNEAQPSTVESRADQAWHRIINIQIGPGPDLTDGQKLSIELDYGMSEGHLRIPTRVAMASYLIRQLRLDAEQDSRPSFRRQIVMLNRSEVEAAQRECGCIR